MEEQVRRNKNNTLNRVYSSFYPWQRQFNAATKGYNACMLMAANQCVAAHTEVIFSTEKGRKSAQISEFASYSDESVVCLVDGCERDQDNYRVYFRGILPTIRLYLSNGQFLDCTDEHKLLTSSGYLSARQLVLTSGAQRCFGISADCPANYDEDDYLYDQPLREQAGIDPVQLPSLIGAPQHIRSALLRKGEAEQADQCSPACLYDDLRSNLDGRRHASALNDKFSSLLCKPSAEHLSGLLRVSPLLVLGYIDSPQLTAEDCLRIFFDCGAACSNHIFFPSDAPQLSLESTIVAWQPIGFQPCYDLVVPDANNYISSGVASHNCGKTRTGTTMDAFHLLGNYPDDWEGRTFNSPPMCWMLGYSGEKTRDLLQYKLFGRYDGREWEGGLIPKDKILDHKAMSGTSGAMREVRVQHTKGISTCQFWSYSQGQHALMGDVVDWYHIDEEPEDPEIFPQVITRTLNGDRGKGGSGILTFTPENGMTQLVCKFMGEAYDGGEDEVDIDMSGIYLQTATWDDALHLNEKMKKAILALYPAYQRDMRSKGVPLMGEGLIYPYDEESIKVPPFEVPDYWFVINALDFGWDHPQAHIQMVWDRDADIYYIINAWKASKKQPFEAWHVVKPWAESVPTAWPADGLQTEKGSARQQKDYYEDEGFNLLPEHAQWEDGGNGVWAGIMEINNLIATGRLKVVSVLVDWFAEFRQYHTKARPNGKSEIVKVKDDLLDATRYAYMMRRYAIRVCDLYPDVYNEQIKGPDGRDENTGY